MKQRLRLVKLEDCQNGTRFYTSRKWQPRTLITINKKYYEAVYHIGHLFDIKAKQLRMNPSFRVWAVIKQGESK